MIELARLVRLFATINDKNKYLTKLQNVCLFVCTVNDKNKYLKKLQNNYKYLSISPHLSRGCVAVGYVGKVFLVLRCSIKP